MNQHEQALQDFIKKHPKAQLRQSAIDKRLKLCHSDTERLVVIFKMMWGSFYQLKDALQGNTSTAEVIEFKKEERKP